MLKPKTPRRTTCQPAWQKYARRSRQGLEAEWESMAGAAIDGTSTLLDEIARVLRYKTATGSGGTGKLSLLTVAKRCSSARRIS